MAIAFSVWGATVTLVQIYFSLLINSWIENLFIPQILATSAYHSSFFVRSRTFTFSLKGNILRLLISTSLLPAPWLCTLRPILSKIMVTWTQSLWFHRGRPDKEMSTKWLMQNMLEKGMIHLLSGQNRKAEDFIMLLRKSHNLKPTSELFLKFPI